MNSSPPPAADKAMDAVIEKVQKILALGRRGGSEAESEAAMAKAMALLEEHNLSLATVDSHVAGSARREKAAQAGGQYVYQRNLWKAVCELNFCMYLSEHKFVRYGSRDVLRRFHLVVGRVVNAQTAIALATYLEGVTDRLCRERLTVRSGAGVTPGDLNAQFYSSWAVSYRVGIADRVIEKLKERREERLAAEHTAKAAADRAGTSTSQAVTLSTYVDKETDANIDFLHGEGTAAEWAADRAEIAAERRADEDAYTAWKAENPEDARNETKRRKFWTDRGYTFRVGARGKGGSATRQGPGYWAGYDDGQAVSIDQQAGSANTKRIK